MKNKKGFTLVELLAVIVILAIILVIAVPQIMDTIDDARNASLASSAKMVASQAENQYTVKQTLGEAFTTENGDCLNAKWAGLNTTDYDSCTYNINSNGKAEVTIVGANKFEGKYVCNGTRTDAEVTEEECSGGSANEPVETVSFTTDSLSTIVAAVQYANRNNQDYPYTVGDTKIIEMDIDGDGTPEEYTIRVANTTKCGSLDEDKRPISQTTCDFVIEFAGVISTHNMNDTDTNGGGWSASKMKTYLNDKIYNALPTKLKNGIIDTYVVSSYGQDDASGNLEDGNFGYNHKLYLLSPEEIYGTTFTSSNDSSKETSRQLDYYKDNNVTTSNFSLAIKKDLNNTESVWWTRSACFTDKSGFYIVHTDGDFYSYYTETTYATSINGVSPAFRIG